ncbi:MAG: late competence development ComFB family protein [bacterium]
MKQPNCENYIEKIVRQELDKLYEDDKDLCRCDLCYRDIMTLTLNKLPSMYVSSDIGHIMTMYNLTKDQLHANVVVELLRAIEQVRGSPKH